MDDRESNNVNRRELLNTSSAVLALGALGAVTPDRLSAAETPLAKTPFLTTPFDGMGYMKKLSNWGKWGKDDMLGALNYITPAVRAAALRTARDGITVSCAWDIRNGTSPDPHEGMMRRTMFGLPAEQVGGSAHWGKSLTVAGDSFEMITHGGTHVDAINHIFVRGKMYNGFPDTSVTRESGGTYGDPTTVKDGIVTRGVLIDMPALRGVKMLERGYGVTPEDLEAAEKRQNVKVREGDVLLLRTGYDTQTRENNGFLDLDKGCPGWHFRSLPWLHERGVAAIGHDGPQEVYIPNRDKYVPGPGEEELFRLVAVHSIGSVAMGLWLIDFCQLEALAAKCAELNRYEFLFTANLLRLKGSTASPVNPIAIF